MKPSFCPKIRVLHPNIMYVNIRIMPLRDPHFHGRKAGRHFILNFYR